MAGTYSGSGPYRGGGSLSSSNLSALAPPFKVDKSHPKSNSTNPSMNYSEVPVYGSLFDPAGPFWNTSSGSSTPGTKYVATEAIGTSTTCPTSPNIYGYPGSQSSNPPYYLRSNTGAAAYDPFSYDQFPHSVPASSGEAAKPYYPSYVSPPPQKDGYLGLGVIGGPGYDLLSNSASANLSGGGSSQVDHTQGVSGGGEYKPKWGDFWMGVGDGEHGKWTDYAQGFGSKDIDLSSSSGDKNNLLVDGSNKGHPSVDGSSKIQPFGDGSNTNHLKQGACQSQGYSHGKVTTVSDNCFDIFGGAYSFGGLGLKQQDCKSSFDLNSGGTSTICLKVPTFTSATASKESPHLQEPVLESVTAFCGPQNANASSLEEQFSQTGPFVFSCTSATSTFPINLSNFSAQSTLSATKANSMGSDAANKSGTTAGYDSAYQKEPQVSRGSKCQSSIIIRRPLSSFMPASSSQIGVAVGRLDDKDASDKTKFRPQLPHQFSSDGFDQEIDDDEALYSLEKHSSSSEVHNPAEESDSPCWKGASSSRFSPFGVPEAVASDVLVENMDGCKSLSSQESQSKGILMGTFNSIDFSSRKVGESTSSKRPQNENVLVDTSGSEKANDCTSLKRPYVSTCTSKDHEDFGSVNQKPHCFDLNTGAGFQFGEDYPVDTEDFNMLNKTKADSDSSLATQQILKDGEVSSVRNLSDTAAERIENCSPVADGFSGVPSNIGNKLSSSPPGDNSSLKYFQSPTNVSDSRTDINVLLKTMTNLSEVFLRYCCRTNPAAVKEQHSMTIKHIIDNLSASLLVMARSATPAITVSLQGTSFHKELAAAMMVNDAEEVAAAVKVCRRTEDFLDSVSFKDDADTLDVENNTEAIKNILHENLHEDEEMDQQKLLYKNLWLEAEAALCAMTAKARLHRMKMEMGGIHGSTIDAEKPPSSKISSDMRSVVEVASNDKNSPALVACDHESPRPSATNQCNHTDVSVMKKFPVPVPIAQIIRARREVGGSSLDASSPGTSGNDSDGSGTTSHAADAESSVTARYQILKDRINKSDSLKQEGSHSEENSLLDKDYSNLDTFGNDSHGTGSTSCANNTESSVLARYEILKCQADSSDSLNCGGKQSSGEEDYLLDNVSLNPDKPLLNSELSNSIGVTDDKEDSVMARFRIIQSRINGLNSVNKEPTQGQANKLLAEDETQGFGWTQQTGNIRKRTFGPYPDFTQDEDVKEFGVCIDGERSTQSCQANKLSSEIFEGWYDNDYSSSDWEHVSKEDLRRQN